MTGRPRHILVTDASRGSAIACIRSLGGRGWTVTAADADRRSPGFRSRYATHRLVYPDPTVDAEGMIDRIHGAVASARVDVVLPVTDDVGLPLAAARERFDGLTRLALPDPGVLELARDKAATIAVAERLGIPVPATRTVADGASAVAVADELGWPVVIKPQVSRATRDDGSVDAFTVSYAGDLSALRARVDALEGRTSVLLQRWSPGVGVGVELLAHEGRPLAAFQHRRLREVPVTGGASSLRESVPLDPVLLGHATRLLAELSWTGLAMVEFRITPNGPELMEINGRVWGSLPLAVRAGMDFPGRFVDLLLDGPPPPGVPTATDYRIGVRARNLRLDASWIGNVVTGRRQFPELPFPPRRAGALAAVSLLDPRIADDLLTRTDPGPGVAQLVAIARDVVGKGVRRAT